MLKLDKTDKIFYKCSLTPWKGNPKSCRWCNKELSGRQEKWCSTECGWRGWENHQWSSARKAALYRDAKMCVKCGSTFKLEVNHKVPILSKHNINGCWHHLSGLEVLCNPCHLKVTNIQRLQGLFDKG